MNKNLPIALLVLTVTAASFAKPLYVRRHERIMSRIEARSGLHSTPSISGYVKSSSSYYYYERSGSSYSWSTPRTIEIVPSRSSAPDLIESVPSIRP